MNVARISGVDTGLVHTGVVSMQWDKPGRRIKIATLVVSGPDPVPVAQFVKGDERIFIEDYRQRSAFNSDVRMIKAVNEMKAATGGELLNNMGVKKVVKPELMKLLGVWNFATPTHHQDLRSAARILLFGMLKDDTLNKLVTAAVQDHLRGRTWTTII